MGLDQFEKICQRVSVPVFALGGLGRETCRDAMAAGAAGIAAIGLFQEAQNLPLLVHELLNDPPQAFTCEARGLVTGSIS